MRQETAAKKNIKGTLLCELFLTLCELCGKMVFDIKFMVLQSILLYVNLWQFLHFIYQKIAIGDRIPVGVEDGAHHVVEHEKGGATDVHIHVAQG